MNRGELFARSDEQSLLPLVELSDHLVLRNGRVRGIDRLDVPLDEFGIPKRREFVKLVLGTISTKHYWTGFHDIHHLAWPGAKYRAITHNDDIYLASKYRGCASLKVRVPRQLHNYFHKITHEPTPPDIEIMRQWHLEQAQVNRLYDTISRSNLAEHNVDESTKEIWRKDSFVAKLEKMQDGELGLMPNRESLSSLELTEARSALRGLAQVKGFSNSRQSHRSFFEEAA